MQPSEFEEFAVTCDDPAISSSSRRPGNSHSQVTGCKGIINALALCACKIGTVGYDKGKTAP